MRFALMSDPAYWREMMFPAVPAYWREMMFPAVPAYWREMMFPAVPAYWREMMFPAVSTVSVIGSPSKVPSSFRSCRVLDAGLNLNLPIW